MCFGGQQSSQSAPQAPAPAPAPPAPAAVEAEIGANRKIETDEEFGPKGPRMRIDRSVTAAGSTAGGAGIKM